MKGVSYRYVWYCEGCCLQTYLLVRRVCLTDMCDTVKGVAYRHACAVKSVSCRHVWYCEERRIQICLVLRRIWSTGTVNGLEYGLLRVSLVCGERSTEWIDCQHSVDLPGKKIKLRMI